MTTGPTSFAPRTVRQALTATFRLLWQESDAFARRQLAFSFVLLFLGSVLYVLYPVAYKLVIDALSGQGSLRALATPALLIGTLVVCNYFTAITLNLRQLVHGLGVQRLNRRISDALFQHLMRLPLKYHVNRKTGAVGETISQGLNGCQLLLQHAVFTFLPVTIEFIAIIIVLTQFQHAAYLGILGISGALYGYVFWRAAEQVAGPSRIYSERHIETQATLTDSLLNYETVKYFHAERAICRRYDERLAEREQGARRVLTLKAGQSVLLSTIFAISMGVSLGYAGYEVLQGTMTIGDFVLINTYVARLMQPLESLGLAARDASQALAYLEKMLDMFREPQEVDRAAPAAPSAHRAGRLEFDRVTFSYTPERTTLRDVSFDVPAGRTLGIVGSSGSGKTSIIRLLFRLYSPDAGVIRLDGIPLENLSLETLRGAIAVVPQDNVLFNDTLGANIAFGRLGATQADIAAAARLAHLDDFIRDLPEGYRTRVGERGLKLSGGEKQRVAIARAALKRPLIYVFDEATSSLDTQSERDILQNLIDVAKTSTTIVIAHRLSTVAHADEILVLNNGEVVERGSHGALLTAKGAYAALWRAQNAGRGTSLPGTAAVSG